MDERSRTAITKLDLCDKIDVCEQAIQEATASEPLTLEEEYAMQRSWRSDGDKLTFIVCQSFEISTGERQQDSTEHAIATPADQPHLQREIDAVIGDVNLFISTTERDVMSRPESNKTDGVSDANSNQTIIIGELELMIASSSHRGKGLGKAALVTFLAYIIRHEKQLLDEFRGHAAPERELGQFTTSQAGWHFDHFAVKIGNTNHASIALFESLGFKKTSMQASYFGEFELRMGRREVMGHMSGDWWQVLRSYDERGYSCAFEACVRVDGS